MSEPKWRYSYVLGPGHFFTNNNGEESGKEPVEYFYLTTQRSGQDLERVLNALESRLERAIRGLEEMIDLDGPRSMDKGFRLREMARQLLKDLQAGS